MSYLTSLALLLFQHPNIVLIRIDDARADDLEFMAETQNRIQAQGVTFANSFVTVSLCCPSRATVLTGQMTHNNGVYGNFPPFGGYNRIDESSTIATWLASVGYWNVHLGKFANGYAASTIPPGWSEWYTLQQVNGGGSYFDYYLNENGATVFHGHASGDYSTDVYTAKALTFLRGASAKQPFFMLLDYYAPHRDGANTPPPPAPRHVGLFDNYDPPVIHSAAFNEPDVSDKPPTYQAVPQLTLQEQRDLVDEIRRRKESLLSVDEGVARIMSALSQYGFLANTYVIFTSDNGFDLGEHRLVGKSDFYEDSIRVPLLARGPGIQAGSVRTELVGNVDLASTLAAIAGATPGLAQDGASLLPLMHGQTVPWRSYFFLDAWDYDFLPSSLVRLRVGVRTATQLYVEHDEDHNGAADAFELYDLGPDPLELVSQHADPSRAQEIAALSAVLATLKACSGGACFQ